MKNKAIFPGFACGAVSAALDFWLIPTYLAGGTPDYIWMTLMVVLPTVAAVFLLRKHSPKAVLWGALVQCVLTMVLANPIGKLLGYQLGDIANDFFDYIGYLLFCFGWIIAATAAQYLALRILKRFH